MTAARGSPVWYSTASSVTIGRPRRSGERGVDPEPGITYLVTLPAGCPAGAVRSIPHDGQQGATV